MPSIQSDQKGLNEVAGLEDVLQVEVLTPHRALVQWLKYDHEDRFQSILGD
jgi:hypothetical protein